VIDFLKKIEEEIIIFDKKFKKTLSTKANLLHKVTNYLAKNPGKRIRPICTIISSGLLNDITEKTYRGAILIELLHTATLIHDDIVDDAHLRRSKLSLNAIWKNKISVLSGDYFLAKGLRLAILHKDYEILNITSCAVEKMVEGELMQIEKTRKLNLTEKDYFEIIKLKTGVLFSASFKIGAIAANSDQKMIQKLESIGLKLGVLFQIKDDILDYDHPRNITGKKSANDIKEGKINLPLLYAFKKMTLIEKNKVYKILRKKINTLDELKLVQIIVIKYDGIKSAEILMHKYYADLIKDVEGFRSCKYKEAFTLLLNFLIHRDR
jgi:octaprenyl-diphosphate synthase